MGLKVTGQTGEAKLKVRGVLFKQEKPPLLLPTATKRDLIATAPRSHRCRCRPRTTVQVLRQLGLIVLHSKDNSVRLRFE